MRIIYGNNPSTEEFVQIMNIANECSVSTDIARLLFCRGIDTPVKARKFLSPGKHGFHNPFDLQDMDRAVERITLAKNRNENVLIFGDYDVDGVCATTILYNALKIFGITARTTVPEREDGYGLNLSIIDKFQAISPIDLIITVDCGISDKDIVSELQMRGIDVIVTDHHEPPENLPDCIRVNPKIPGQAYPFDGLCGAGVSYKLAYALIGSRANDFLDYVSLATIADNMELVGENRDIVTEGLKLFNGKKMRLEFKYLLGDNTKAVTAQTIIFNISPKVNAGGRKGDANTSLRLLLTSDEKEKFDLAVKLNAYNIQRQMDCENIHSQAREQILNSDIVKNDFILVYGENWQEGSVGIVASKLVEEFCRPVIVFANHGDYLKGSARSIDGVNIHQAITASKDLLVAFGGHSQAAGVSVRKENFEQLRKNLNTYIKEVYGKLDIEKKVYAEWHYDKEFPLRFARELELLEPFGIGNRKPCFSTTVGQVKSTPLKQNSPHCTFNTPAIEMLHFNGVGEIQKLALPINKTIVFEPNLSEYKGRENLKGYVKTVAVDNSDLSPLKYNVFQTQLQMLLSSDKDTPLTTGDKKDIKPFGYCTLYALSDYKNLAYYEELKSLPISAYVPTDRSLCDSVVLCPTILPCGYNRVVYLDRPLSTLDGAKENIILNEKLSITALNELSVDRSDFAKVYAVLRSLCGKEFINSSWAYDQYNIELNGYMFVFGCEVFLELGIFYLKNGILYQDVQVQNALTNSKLYSKICYIKGVTC